jgi:hypothetical protein
MIYEPLDINNIKTGIYTSNELTSVDVGDVIRVQHSDGLYYAEIIAIETGDAGEVLVFQYIKPRLEKAQAPVFKINRPFHTERN